MFERRQLQNGADAAARTMAQAVRRGPEQLQRLRPDDDGRRGGHQQLERPRRRQRPRTPAARVSPPASAGASPEPSTCLRAPLTPLGAVDNWVQCPALPSAWAAGTLPYVQVYTITADQASVGALDRILGSTTPRPTPAPATGGARSRGQLLPVHDHRVRVHRGRGHRPRWRASARRTRWPIPVKYKTNLGLVRPEHRPVRRRLRRWLRLGRQRRLPRRRASPGVGRRRHRCRRRHRLHRPDIEIDRRLPHPRLPSASRTTTCGDTSDIADCTRAAGRTPGTTSRSSSPSRSPASGSPPPAAGRETRAAPRRPSATRSRRTRSASPDSSSRTTTPATVSRHRRHLGPTGPTVYRAIG